MLEGAIAKIEPGRDVQEILRHLATWQYERYWVVAEEYLAT
jgi:hypothetical protein